MTMKTCTVFIFCALFTYSYAIKNYIGTDMQKCVNCLCHARTGCYSRYNCAGYSIDFNYWKQANSPVVDRYDPPDNKNSYNKCKKNENCIIATIVAYTESFGKIDCNCDSTFDCKDRLAIHLFGNACKNPIYGEDYARRFNTCGRQIGVEEMLAEEGYEECLPAVY